MIEQTLKVEGVQLRHPVERRVLVKSVLVQLELTGRHGIACKDKIKGTHVKISKLLASLAKSRQQVGFGLLVPGLNNLLTTCEKLDWNFEGCFNNSNTDQL